MPTLHATFNPQYQKIKEHLEHELLSIRTGRATPSLIEYVSVSAYHTTMKLMELASISAPDPKTLVVDPWDKSVIKDIERGLTEADTGCGIAVDKDVIRLTIPDLTEETREVMKKQVNKLVEKTKVALRGIRDEARGKIQTQERNKEISEDEKFRQFEHLDGEIKKMQEEFEKMGEKKTKELDF